MQISQVIDILEKRNETSIDALCVEGWQWKSGVLLYCMARAYKMTDERVLYDYIKGWIDKYSNERLFGSVNFVATANALLTLTQGDDEYKKIADEYAKWCKRDAHFTCDGGFAHVWAWPGELPDYVNQLWLDTLFMTVPFMVSYGLKYNDDEIIEKALKQIDIHTNGAYDEKTGLYFHAYHCVEKRVMGQRWGRGNGWVAAALSHTIVLLEGTKWDISKYKTIAARMLKTAYDLRSKEDGMLHTVLDLPESYTEYTATMLFSIAAFDLFPLRIIDKDIYEWARNNQQNAPNMLGDNGLQKCSHGTDAKDIEHYLTRPYCESAYAYGLFILLLSYQEDENV